MPLAQGVAWTYRTGAGEEITLRISGSDARDGFLVATVDTLGLVTPFGAPSPAPTTTATAAGTRSGPAGEETTLLQTSFLCSDDGIEAPIGDAIAGAHVHIEVLSNKGATIPPARAMKPGARWTTIRALRLTRGEVRLRTQIVSTHTFAATEKVQTPAGSFDAARIDVDSDVTWLADDGGAPRPDGSLPTHQTSHQWFARGVGLVRMKTDAAPASPEAGAAEPATLDLVRAEGLRGR